jgi:hypothetical protein
MTYRELSNAFDVYSNRHAEAKLETLLFFDEYEKSLFLTQAADEIVKELLPFYDRNEKIKKQLLPITKSVQLSLASGVNDTLKFSSTNILYELPGDVLYVVNEFLKAPSGATLSVVKPLADDETSSTLESPFRTPSKRTYAYRNSLAVAGKYYSEIITNALASADPKYFIRYVSETPAFIVTEDLLDGSIGGVSTNANLDEIAPLEMLHNKILNRAILIGYESKSDDVNAKNARQKDSNES